MRLAALMLALAALLSAWALAHPRPGQMHDPKAAAARATSTVTTATTGTSAPDAGGTQARGTGQVPAPGAELGTIALTSLGLLALGLSLRRRRRH